MQSDLFCFTAKSLLQQNKSDCILLHLVGLLLIQTFSMTPHWPIEIFVVGLKARESCKAEEKFTYVWEDLK